jgi:dihydrodipicolinate synthase/N-acetylneuraminate lyase
MNKPYFISAIGTPLTEDEQLHEKGLEMELADHWNHGIDGVLVAGTMGAMQLLTDKTYRTLIESAVHFTAGRGEVLVGAGDAGYSRSKERIEYINQFKVDGIAVLTPYFWKFSQELLVEYYRSLADVAKSPLYLYDLPIVTGTKISTETFLELAKHPNIRGAKLSCDVDFVRQLIDHVDDSFRIIVAAPNLIDVLLKFGINEHLDGMWSILPGWTVALGQCVVKGDMEGAAKYQQQITEVRNLLAKYSFSAFTTMMNARGLPGKYAPRPFIPLSEVKKQELLQIPVIRQMIEQDRERFGNIQIGRQGGGGYWWRGIVWPADRRSRRRGGGKNLCCWIHAEKRRRDSRKVARRRLGRHGCAVRSGQRRVDPDAARNRFTEGRPSGHSCQQCRGSADEGVGFAHREFR